MKRKLPKKLRELSNLFSITYVFLGCNVETDFFCDNDAECISCSLVCDGKNHCSDGSDEEEEVCSKIKTNFSTKKFVIMHGCALFS